MNKISWLFENISHSFLNKVAIATATITRTKNVTNLHIIRFKKSKTAALHELFSGLYISQSFSSFPQRDLFCSCVNEVSTCRQLKIFSCNLPIAQIYKFRDSCVANIFTTQATWNNLQITIAGRAKLCF